MITLDAETIEHVRASLGDPTATINCDWCPRRQWHEFAVIREDGATLLLGAVSHLPKSSTPAQIGARLRMVVDARTPRSARVTLKAPFPWFGGKSRCADLVWQRFGAVRNYVEPFFGSGAVLLARPTPFAGVETINDLDGLVANFWRATKHAPAEVAKWADNPVNENDLHARHLWLVSRMGDLPDRLNGDPDWYDAQIAGWWVWGLCCWIGGGWCSGSGPWVRSEDGRLVDSLQLPHLGDNGQGINRKRPHIGSGGQGVLSEFIGPLADVFAALSARLARTRVCSGDWSRVTSDTVTRTAPAHGSGFCGVFLDPPYADTADRDVTLYRKDSLSVAHDVRAWAIENGDRPNMRIALCGYEGEHTMPESWECVPWKPHGGLGHQSREHDNPNARRERIWFSPHCLRASQGSLL